MKVMRFLRPYTMTAVVGGLLAAHALLAYSATLDASATFDEVLHIASGFSYWRFNDYRLQPENGNLPQRWCALPLFLSGCPFPDDEAAWRHGDAFQLGQRLLYEAGQAPARILAAARGMAVVWSTLLCLVVFLWSRSLYGTHGGLVSLTLAAFWPALLAHGPLATSDACGSLFFTLGAWSLWELVHVVTGRRLLAAGVSVGLAAIAKHSCVLLVPLAIVFVIARTIGGRPALASGHDGRKSRNANQQSMPLVGVVALLVPLGAAMACIWVACGFRYRAFEPGSGPTAFYRYATLAECVGYAGGVGEMCDRLAAWRLLPESWLWGMSQVVARAGHRYAFAVGEHSVFGWWWFFPLCMAIKNTLPSLALCGWGVGLSSWALVSELRGKRSSVAPAWEATPLLLTLACLWPMFVSSHLNIGERHLLPAYPPLMILAGGTWPAATSRRLRAIIVLLVGLHAVDVTSRWPCTLAYFNQLVPRGREHRWLVDSSLDWGQDLGRLGVWLNRNARPGEPVFVTYAGAAPVAAHVPAAEILGFPRNWGSRQELPPGLYCVSATALHGIADRPRGPWCRAFEAAYQEAARWMDDPAARNDAAAAVALVRAMVRDRDELGLTLSGDPPSPGDLAVAAFNILQAGRLKSFLRCREPDASIGGSILVYRLDAEAIEKALHGPPAELADRSWFERERYGTADELVRQGRRHLDAGRPTDAVPIFESATRLYPGDPRAWDGLMIAYRGLGDDLRAAQAERYRDRLRARLSAAEAQR